MIVYVCVCVCLVVGGVIQGQVEEVWWGGGEGTGAALGKNRNDDQGKQPTLEHTMASKALGLQSMSTCSSFTPTGSCLNEGFQREIIKGAFVQEGSRVNASIFTAHLFSFELWGSLQHNKRAR